jgi:uncharacterized coiled-coil DUF342 family protein
MSAEVKKLKDEIQRLNDELLAYKSDTSICRMYLGIKKQIDAISILLSETDINADDLNSKDDKMFERYFKFIEKSKEISETFIYLEKLVLPKLVEKQQHGGILEEALNV